MTTEADTACPGGGVVRDAAPRIGDHAPEFRCRSTGGPISLADYRGRWLIFFSHPADFTPVCTTEFVAFARHAEDFAKANCALLGHSVDSLFSHMAWLRAIEARFEVKVPFPVIEDPSMAIARAYGMLDPAAKNSATVRGLFIIDPEGIIRMSCFYPMSAGRNVAEILRTLHALQAGDAHQIATPENWQPGEPVIDIEAMAQNNDAGLAEWIYPIRNLELAQ